MLRMREGPRARVFVPSVLCVAVCLLPVGEGSEFGLIPRCFPRVAMYRFERKCSAKSGPQDGQFFLPFSNLLHLFPYARTHRRAAAEGDTRSVLRG